MKNFLLELLVGLWLEKVHLVSLWLEKVLWQLPRKKGDVAHCKLKGTL
jgi:hypothetical protein